MRLQLAANQQMRTATIRVKSDKDRKKLSRYIYLHKHFENMLLIAIKQNYDLYKEDKDSNDFAVLSSYRVMRAVISDTEGGKHKNQVAYIKEKYKKNKLLQELIELGKSLKIHNLSMLINEMKGNYQSFFTKIKNGDKTAKPPKPKKLSKLHKFTIPLDFNSWSLKQADQIGINLATCL